MADTKIPAGQGKVTNVVRLGVPREAVQSVRIVDTDLVVTLKNGKKVVIPDGAIKAMMDPDFRIAFQDTDVLASDVLRSAGPLDVNSISTTTLTDGGDAAKAAGHAADGSGSIAAGHAGDGGAVANGSSGASTFSLAPTAAHADAASATLAETAGQGDASVLLSTAPTTMAAVAPTQPAAKSGMFSFLDSLPPSLGALGALGALGMAAKAGDGGTAANNATSYSVSGEVVLGPVVSQLEITVYDKSGNKLYSGTTDLAGNYTFKVTNGYSGAILIVVTDANGTSVDYRDEATGQAKSLGSTVVRAVNVADGTNDITMNVTPLTELAVRQMGVTTNVAPSSTVGVNTQNTQIAALYGLNNVVTDPITPLINGNGSANTTAGNATTPAQVIAQTYGEALAALSGLDKATTSGAPLSGLSTVQTALNDALTSLGSNASTAALKTTVTTNVANNLATASAPLISFNPASGSNGVTVKYSWMSIGDIVTLSDNGNVVASYTVGVADTTNQYVVLNDSAWGQGATHALSVTIAAAVTPNAPVSSAALIVPSGALDSVSYGGSSHTITNVNQNAVYDITAGGGDTVTVKINGTTYTATETATGSGLYKATITGTLADGSYTPVITVTDAAGNTSTANGTAYTVKTMLATPTGHLDSTSDSGTSNSDNLTNVKQNAVYDVTAESGDTVTVKIGGGTYTATETVAGSGQYQATITGTLADGSYTPVITVTDVAGNTSQGNGTAYVVNTTHPALISGTLDTGSDSGASNADGLTNLNQNLVYNVVADSGNTVTVSIGNVVYTATETTSGHYAVTVTAQLADGTYTPQITVTNSAGTSTTGSGTAIVVDTHTPALTSSGLDTTSQSGSVTGVTNVTTPLYDIVTDAGATVSVVINGVTYTATESVAQPGHYTVAVPTANALPPGTYTPLISITDKAGTALPQTSGTSFEVLSTAISVAGHLDAASVTGSVNTYTSQTSPTYDIVSTPNATVTVVLNGTTYTAVESSFNPGYYTIVFPGLSAGTYAPAITVVDQAGTSVTNSGTAFTVKTAVAAPSGALAATSDSGSSNSDGLTNVTTPTYAVTAESGDKVVVTLNGVSYTATESATTPGRYTIAVGIGNALVAGTYTPQITVTDKAGNTNSATATAFTIKTALATPSGVLDAASDSGTSSSDSFTKVTTPTYDVVAESGDTVTVKINGANYTATESTTNPGHYTVAVPAASALAAGTYTPQITVTDQAGNQATANGVAFTVKTAVSTAPSGSLNAASVTGTNSNGTNVRNPSYDIVTEAGDTVTVQINGKTYTAVESTTTAGRYTVSVPVADALSPGTYTPQITVTDKAGNTASANGTAFIVKTTAVVIGGHLDGSSDSGASNSDGITNVNQNLVYDVTAETGDTVTVTIGGVAYNAVETVAGSGQYKATITATLADGTYSAQVAVVDSVGNSASTLGTAFTVVHATSAPTGALDPTSVPAGALADHTASPTPVYDIVAATGSTVTALINGTTYTATESSTNPGHYTVAVTSALTDGTYPVSMTVTDKAGNTASGSGSFVVKTGLLTPTGQLDAGNVTGSGAGYTNVKTPTYDVVTDSGVTVKVTLNGITYTATESSTNPGHYTVAVPTANALADGTYTPVITAADSSGNTKTVSGTPFTVDTVVPPAPTGHLDSTSDSGTSNSDNLTKVNQNAVYDVTAESGDTVTVKVGSTTYTATETVAGSGLYKATITGTLTDATYTPQITVTDKAGNTASANGTAYTVKTALATPTGHLDSTSDSGTSSSDNLTNVKQNAVYDVTAESGDTVTVKINGTNYTATETVAGSGQYKATITGTLADASYTPQITVTDKAGNTASANGTAYTVKTALAAPTGHLDSTSDSGTSSSDNLTNVKQNAVYDVTAESGDTVTVKINGTTYTATETVAGSGLYKATITGTLADGSYTPVITVSDAAGNTSTANGTAYTVKTALAAPTGHLDSTSDSGTSSSDNLTNVKQNAVYDVTAESGDTVTVKINGTNYTATETVAGSGLYKATITGTLSDGSYTPVITVSDAAGNTSTANGTAYTVKTTLATPTGHLDSTSDSGTSNSDNLTNVKQNAVYDVTAESGDTVTVKIGSTTYTATETVAGSGLYKATITGTLSDGSYTPVITVTDAAGNTASANGTAYTVKTALAAPTGHLDSTSDSGTSSSDNLTNVKQNAVYDVTAESGDTVTVKINGTTYTATETVAGSGLYKATITGTLADGTYTPVITITDKAGNTNTANGTAYTVKTALAAPTGHLDSTSDSGSSNSDNLTNVKQNAVYDVTAESGDTVTVKINGTNYTAAETVAGSGNYQATITSTLADGSYTPVITITDKAGNTNTANGTAYTVKTALAAPTGHLDSTSDSGTSSSDNLTNVKQNAVYDVTAESGDTVTVKIGSTTYTATETVAGSGLYKATITGTLADGSYTPQITVTDAAGNTSTANGTAYTVKTALAAPTGHLDSTSDSGTSNSDNLTNVKQNAVYDVTAESGDTVTVKIGSTTYTATETVAGSGQYQATITGTLADGSYTPVITVSDAAGNTSTANGTAYTVKTALATPTGHLDSTSDSGTSSSDNLTNVKQNAVYDVTAESGDTVTVKINGTNYTATETVVGSGQYKATITGALADGSYTPVITVNDAAGNTSTGNGTAYTVITSSPSMSTVNTALLSGGVSKFSTGATSAMVQNVTGSTSGAALFAVTGTATQTVVTDSSAYIGQVKVSVTSFGGFNSTQELFVAGASGISLSATIPLTGTVTVGGTTWNYVRDTSNNITFSLPTSNNQGLATTSMASQLLSNLYWHDSAGAAGTYQISYTLINGVGNTSPTYTETYVVTSGVPTAATAITALSNDTGTAGDFITTVASQTVSGTYSGTLRTSDQIQVSANGGTTWVTATVTGIGTWSASGVTLQSGTATLTTRVIDVGGNLSAATQGSQSYTLDSAPTLTASITAVTDAVGTSSTGGYSAGDYTGTVPNGASTDDTKAVISGTLLAALGTGQVVNVYDGAVLLGAATVSGTTWTYTPTSALAAGIHSFTAAVVNTASGAKGTASSAYAINEESMSSIVVQPHVGAVISPMVRYIMLRRDPSTADNFDVAELQVMVNGTNVALNKAVTVGPQGTYSGFSGSNLVDGSSSSPYAGGVSALDSWVQVDLGAYYSFNSISIIITPRSGWESRLNGTYVLASNVGMTGSTLTQLLSGASDALVLFGQTSTTTLTASQTLTLTNAVSTIDTTPALTGTLGAPLATGETVQIYDGSTLLGTATVTGLNWSYTPSTALTLGAHSLYAKLMNGSTVEIVQSMSLNIVASTTPTQTAAITAVTDNVGTSSTGGYSAGDYTGTVPNGASTDDPKAVISGTLSAALAAGQAVNIYDGSILLGAATVSGTTWTYTPTSALAAGIHSLTAAVVNTDSGAKGTASSAYAINEESMSSIVVQPHVGAVISPMVRYIMLRRDPSTADYFDVAELQVMVNGTNVALNKAVTVGPQGTYSGFSGSNLVDGSGSSPYAGGVSALDSWVQVDLGTYYSFNSISIIITPRSGFESRINGTYVLASDVGMTGSTLTQLLSGASDALVLGQTLTTTLTAPQTLTLTLTNAVSTIDTTPALMGTLGAPLATGETVRIYDGSTLLGTATVTGLTWSYTPATALTVGSHTLYAQLMNGSTVEIVQSMSLNIVASTTPTQTAAITAVTDNVGTSSTGGYSAGDYTGTLPNGASTDDTKAVISGTLSAALAAGQVAGLAVNIYDGSILLGAATVSGTNWTYTPTTALTAGTHSFTAAVVNTVSGAKGTASSAYVINEESISAISVTPHTGRVIANSTVDSQPTLSGTLGAPLGSGETIQIYDGSTLLGTATVTGLTWSYTPATALTVGSHTLYAQLVNGSTVEMVQSMPVTIVASTTPTQTATITAVTDGVGSNAYGSSVTGTVTKGTSTDDPKAVISGTLSAALGTNQVVNVYDGSTLLGTATVTGMTWSYTPTTALTAGTHNFTAAVANTVAGTTGTASSAWTINEETVLLSVTAHTGSNAGTLASGAMTIDAQPTLNITLGAAIAAGERVAVYDNGMFLGTASGSGTSYSFTPSVGLLAGGHALVVQVENASTGSATTGRAVGVFILTESAAVTPMQTVVITGVTDAASLNGSATGNVATGTATDDTLPTLAGTLSAALAVGQQLAVYDNGSLLGYATLSGTAWTYQPSTALATGNHAFTAKVVDVAASLVGTASSAYTVVEQSVTLAAVGSAASTGSNAWAASSGQSTFSGTLGAALGTNEYLAVFADQVYVGTATVTGTSWTFSPGTALTTGSHTLRFEVVDGSSLNSAGYSAGHANSAASTVTVDGSTPTAVAAIVGVTANTGTITGAVASGGTLGDPMPTISGTLSDALYGPNQAVKVFDNGTLLGNANVVGFTWSFTPTTALAAGSHSLTAQVVNLATGTGTSASSAYALDEQSVSITAITDHTGPLTGNVLASTGTTTTDDTGVTLTGTLGHALSGQVVSLYDSGVYLGAATVTGTSWSYTGTLATGYAHSLTAVVEVTAGSGLALAKTTATALTVLGYDPVYSLVSNLSLALPGLNQVLDLRQMNTSVQLDEVNVVSSTNTLKVTASALGNLGIKDAYTAASGWSGALVSGDKQLVVDGASGGTVSIDTSGWTQGGAVTHGSTTYNSYTNGTAQLLIDTHLTVRSVL